MLAVMPGALDVTAAVDLLRRARLGPGDVPGVAGDPVLHVVDLDTAAGPGPLELFPTFPGVVVGISRTPAGTGPPSGVDAALTPSPRPPAPWVEVGDLDEAIEVLRTATERTPSAAVTLVQVLRGTGRGALGHDLVTESLAYSSLQAGPEFGAWLAARTPRSPRPPEGAPAVVTERSGARVDVTLNRPGVRNAFSASMRDQLCEALSMAVADPSVGEVHLRGAGPDFCSGGDLDEFGTAADPASAHLVRTGRSAARLLAAVAGRTVAHLHGACVGAGIELPALAATVRAAADTRVQLPELSMGLIPGAGGTASLPRRIGRHRTAWMALSGAVVDVTTAASWGLVDELVD